MKFTAAFSTVLFIAFFTFPADTAPDTLKQDAETVLKDIRFSFQNRDYRKVIDLSKSFLENHPDAGERNDVLYFLGTAQLNAGRTDEAINAFEDFLASGKESERGPLVRYLAGQAYYIKGTRKSQQEALRKAEKLFRASAGSEKSPADIKAGSKFLLGLTYMELNMKKEGKEILKQTYEEFPGSRHSASAIIKLAGIDLANLDYASARKHYDLLMSDYTDFARHPSNRSSLMQASVVGTEAPQLKGDHFINAEPELPENLDGKVVLLHFWSTWCPHCRRMLPRLDEIDEKFGDKSFKLVSVTNTHRQDMEKIKNFVEKNKIKYPVIVDEKSESYGKYLVRGVPAGAVVDKNGVIRWRGHTAGITDALITMLVNEKPGDVEIKPVIDLERLSDKEEKPGGGDNLEEKKEENGS